MAATGYLCALLLAAVFGWAALAKLRDTAGASSDFRSIGLPGGLAHLVALTELALVVVLVWRPRIGALAAIVLLACFSAVLTRTVRSGTPAACGCFGSARRRPVSVNDLARNAALAVAGAAALAATRPVAPGIDDVVLASCSALAAIVGLALLDMRSVVGAVWDNTLAGSILAEDAR